MPTKPKERPGASTRRSQKHRAVKRLRRLREDWLRVDLERFYAENQIPTHVFVAAKNFYRESELVKRLVPEQLFFDVTLKAARKNFHGIEVVYAVLGEQIVLVRPKPL